jgi:hypothetical protein
LVHGNPFSYDFTSTSAPGARVISNTLNSSVNFFVTKINPAPHARLCKESQPRSTKEANG